MSGSSTPAGIGGGVAVGGGDGGGGGTDGSCAWAVKAASNHTDNVTGNQSGRYIRRLPVDDRTNTGRVCDYHPQSRVRTHARRRFVSAEDELTPRPWRPSRRHGGR